MLGDKVKISLVKQSPRLGPSFSPVHDACLVAQHVLLQNVSTCRHLMSTSTPPSLLPETYRLKHHPSVHASLAPSALRTELQLSRHGTPVLHNAPNFTDVLAPFRHNSMLSARLDMYLPQCLQPICLDRIFNLLSTGYETSHNSDREMWQ